MVIVEIKNLYKNFRARKILVNLNLKIFQGEFLTIVGPSGCGKTTLLKIIAGFVEQNSGKIFINNKNMANIPANIRCVNMVFQSYALFPHLNVFDNIAFGLRCKKKKREYIKMEVEKILNMVKLKDLKDCKPHQLSGGEQQRVAIARAIINQPLVVLLDEPLSALDFKLRRKMQLELKSLQRKLGITFVLVTHDQQEALCLSDRIVVMNENGLIEQIGTARQIYEKPRNLYVANFVGICNIFTTKVSKIKDRAIEVYIEDQLFTLENSLDLKINQKIYVAIRPEDLNIWDENEVKNSSQMIPATVSEVIYKGSTVDLILQTMNGKFLAATEFFDEEDEDLDFSVGDSVLIEWFMGWEIILTK